MFSANHSNFADPRIGINTSDHTYQSARVSLVDAEDKILLSLKGCTWNLMNYGISLATNGTHMNNPWDFDEDHETYIKRKTRQLDKIITLIHKGPEHDQNDFFLLQEVDIFFPAHEKLKITLEQQAARDFLKTQFEKKLHEQGWDIIFQSGTATQLPLVILYNTKNLNISNASYGVFPTHKRQCRGLAQEFIHQTSERTVTLVNLHLDYAADYSKTIPEFQLQQTQQGKFTIMGGDTNHAPNQRIVGLINNWNNITNLSGGKHGISHHHRNSQQIAKCYDGFFANPDSQTAVHVTEQAAEVFKIDAQSNYIVVNLPASFHVHRSAPGEPWRRDGYKDYMQRRIASSTSGSESISTSRTALFAQTPPTASLSAQTISSVNASDEKKQTSTQSTVPRF